MLSNAQAERMLRQLDDLRPERQLQIFVETVCGRRGCRVVQREDPSSHGWRVVHNGAERLFTARIAVDDNEPARSVVAWIKGLHDHENDEAHP